MDALVTNFHLPESTLIMLISAFAGASNGHERVSGGHARSYRFFSFGDSMFFS